jgi:hypothetical protein
MGANRVDLRGLEPGFLKQNANHLGVMAGDGIADQGAAVQFVGTTLVECQQFAAESRIEGYKIMGQDLQVSRIVDASKHTIGSIKGCPRHEADVMGR